jgi:hypothetical protein
MKKKKALKHVAGKSKKVDKKEEKDILPQAAQEHVEAFNESMTQKNLPYKAEFDHHNIIKIKNTQYGHVMKTYKILRNMKANKKDPSQQIVTFRQQ